MFVGVSVRVSGFERKRGVLVVSITVVFFFNQEKQNADHVGSALFCPTVLLDRNRTKILKDLQTAQHPLTYQPKFTSNFCTLDSSIVLTESLNSLYYANLFSSALKEF